MLSITPLVVVLLKSLLLTVLPLFLEAWKYPPQCLVELSPEP